MSIFEIPRPPFDENSEVFESFSCDPPSDNPDTPDAIAPDIRFDTVFTRHDVMMPDGEEVETWVFELEDADVTRFPSVTLRVSEGQVVHHNHSPSHNRHTVHHHGIGPTPMNDGVGHTSFEISGDYTYQWQASHAGTYIYHCHVNTVLHFEMGMYGFLIVDPAEGEGHVFRENQLIPYDVEALWATDDFDPSWRGMNHSIGLSCPFDLEDNGLNRFDPRYFLVSGVPTPLTETHPDVVRNVETGQTLLIRWANAAYGLTRMKINGLRSELIERDGRTLGRFPDNAYARPREIAPGESTRLPSAGRSTFLVRPRRAGDYRVDFEFVKDWIGRGEVVTASTWIHVTGDPVIDFLEIAGATAIATSVEASRVMFPDGSDVVIVATADNWPDSLAASTLGGMLDAPLLLTGSESLSPLVEEEIERLGANGVFVLGGPRAISPRARIQLNTLLGGHRITRLWGDTRFDTAIEVARHVVNEADPDRPAWDGTVVIATGGDFADALTVGSLASTAGWPVLLTTSDRLLARTEEAIGELGASRAIIVGGPVAVSAEVEGRLDALLGAENVTRLAGNTRYETAVEIARFAVDEGHLHWRAPGIADGTTFADALIGAGMQGRLGSPLLITEPDILHAAVAEELDEVKLDVEQVTFYGSVENLSAEVRNEIRTLVASG